MSRVIKQDRAVDLQGRLAGFPTRLVSAGIDVIIAFGIFVGIYLALSVLWDLLFSDTIEIPVQPPGINAGGLWLTLVIYLTIGWASTGRTIGKQVMGLRLVRRDLQPLGTGQALGRAAFCATFYIGLVFSLFSRRNSALQDMIFKTVVVYDWIPETAKRHLPPPPPPPRTRRRRRAASGEMLP